MSPRGGRRTIEQIESLAALPRGGTAKQWLLGTVAAAAPIAYGALCVSRREATLFGIRSMEGLFTSSAGLWLGMAYISDGAFVHFHFFWGLSRRLRPLAQSGKVIAALVFVPSFVYAIIESVL